MSQSSDGQAVRVVLIGWDGLLGDIVDGAMARDPEVEVIGDYPAGELGVAASADVVLWNNAREDEVSSWLMSLRREPRVLATVGDGRESCLWELTPRRLMLGQLSPSAIVRAMKAEPRDGPA